MCMLGWCATAVDGDDDAADQTFLTKEQLEINQVENRAWGFLLFNIEYTRSDTKELEMIFTHFLIAGLLI